MYVVMPCMSFLPFSMQPWIEPLSHRVCPHCHPTLPAHGWTSS